MRTKCRTREPASGACFGRAGAVALLLCVAPGGCRAAAQASNNTPPSPHPASLLCSSQLDGELVSKLDEVSARSRVEFVGLPTYLEVSAVEVTTADQPVVEQSLQRLSLWVDRATDPSCRKRRLLVYAMIAARYDVSSARVRDVLTDVPPSDGAWAAVPPALGSVARALPSKDRTEFLEQFLAKNDDREIRGEALLCALREAWANEDAESVERLHARLSRPEFRGTRAWRAGKDYDPRHPMAPGNHLPDFSAHSLDGAEPLDRAALDGDLNLLVLWSTSCQPCVEHLPRLRQIAKQYPDVRIVTVAIEDAPASVESFRAPTLLPGSLDGYVSVDEADGLWRRFYWDYVPQYTIVDRDGRIVEGPPRLKVDRLEKFFSQRRVSVKRTSESD